MHDNFGELLLIVIAASMAIALLARFALRPGPDIMPTTKARRERFAIVRENVLDVQCSLSCRGLMPKPEAPPLRHMRTMASSFTARAIMLEMEFAPPRAGARPALK